MERLYTASGSTQGEVHVRDSKALLSNPTSSVSKLAAPPPSQIAKPSGGPELSDEDSDGTWQCCISRMERCRLLHQKVKNDRKGCHLQDTECRHEQSLYLVEQPGNREEPPEVIRVCQISSELTTAGMLCSMRCKDSPIGS